MKNTVFILFILIINASFVNGQSSNDYIEKGLDLYFAEDYKEAAKNFRKAARKDSNNWEAYKYLGIARMELGKNRRALRSLKKAAELQTEDAETYFYIAKLYHNRNRFKEALSYVNKSLEIEPNDIYSLAIRASIFMTINDFESALNDYNKVIVFDPSTAYHYFIRGLIYDKIGNYKNAKYDFEKYVLNEVEEDISLDVYFYRGISYIKLGEYENAISDFKTCLIYDENCIDSHRNLAVAYSELGEYKESNKYISKIIEFGIKDEDIILMLGFNHLCLDNYDQALEYVNQTFSEDFYLLHESYNIRGQIYYLLDDKENALKDFNESLRLFPDYSEALICRASIYGSNKEYDKAMDDLNQIIENNDYITAEAFYDRGLLKKTIGDNDGACFDWLTSWELGYRKAIDMLDTYCE